MAELALLGCLSGCRANSTTTKGNMGRVVGIDLGTTNSVVAIMERGKPKVIPNADGNPLTPSVVAFTPDWRPLVGQLAKKQATVNPEKALFSINKRMERSSYGERNNPASFNQIITSIKRRMGSNYIVKIDNREYTPQEISSMILQKIKRDAEDYLGEKIGKAVITVPAYFNDSQRKATKDAATIADLEVIRIINEPTAAALAYGLDKEDIHTILVWDLGGGTFDVSILELGDGFFEVKAVNGDTHLGGDDYDQRIVNYLADVCQKEQNIDLRQDKITLQILKEVAEKAKIELSQALITNISLSLIYQDGLKNPDIILRREEFNELTEDLRERMIRPTQQALADARLSPEDIDRVILVGGATRMPAIQELAKTLLGKEPYNHIDPDKIVALGAAIQAGILTGEVRKVTLIDVNPLSLGIETMGGVFTRIIERNTPIPTSQSRVFTTARDNQTEVDIHVFQGERAMVRHNMPLDRFRLIGIEPQPRGEARIEVIFDIDVNSIVQVSAIDLQTDNQQKIEINSFGSLLEEGIDQMVEEARIYAEQDRREREKIEASIRANSMICAAEHMIKEVEEKISNSLREGVIEIEQAILLVKEALASSNYQEVKSRTQELERLIQSRERERRNKKKEIKEEEAVLT